MFLVSSCSCLCPIQWSREWRCSWSSADRRCSNYIWVINNFIAYQGATYIRDLTVQWDWFSSNPLQTELFHTYNTMIFRSTLLTCRHDNSAMSAQKPSTRPYVAQLMSQKLFRGSNIWNTHITNIIITFILWSPDYYIQARSISWLLMPWFLVLPGHQQQ